MACKQIYWISQPMISKKTVSKWVSGCFWHFLGSGIFIHPKMEGKKHSLSKRKHLSLLKFNSVCVWERIWVRMCVVLCIYYQVCMCMCVFGSFCFTYLLKHRVFSKNDIKSLQRKNKQWGHTKFCLKVNWNIQWFHIPKEIQISVIHSSSNTHSPVSLTVSPSLLLIHSFTLPIFHLSLSSYIFGSYISSSIQKWLHTLNMSIPCCNV